MRNKTKKLTLWLLAVIIMISLIGAFTLTPQFARLKRAYTILSQDGHLLRNAYNYGKNRQQAIQERMDERKDINKKANASKPLTIPTYEGSGEGAHPDVLEFDKDFNGHKYWMAFTPYPYGKAAIENPSVLVSNDGKEWSVPQGLTNPIVPPPADVASGGHYSDTDILFIDGKIVVYYVYNKEGVPGPSKFYRVESADGIKWTTPELIYESKKSVEGYSPSIVYKDGGYKMWYFGGENKFFYTKSNDGKSWDDITPCNLTIEGWRTWHADVQQTDLGFEAIITSRKDHTNTRALFYAKSTDGINWNVNQKPVLYPSVNSWDSGGIYRSTFIKDKGMYRIWYSAYNRSNRWHIGYTEGRNIDKLSGMK